MVTLIMPHIWGKAEENVEIVAEGARGVRVNLSSLKNLSYLSLQWKTECCYLIRFHMCFNRKLNLLRQGSTHTSVCCVKLQPYFVDHGE